MVLKKWLNMYRGANKKTKNFVLVCIIYGLALMVPVVYCFVRLDFVRSGMKKEQVEGTK